LLEEKSLEAFDNNIKALKEDNAIISKIIEEGLVFDENSYGYSLITRNEDGSSNYDKANSFLNYLDQSGWKD
jgi:hypothetical protein